MTSKAQVLSVCRSRVTWRALLCWTLGLCLALCLTPTGSAWAQATVSKTEQYKQLIEQALSEFRHKNWPEARVLFRRAHELSPSARTLRGMGVVSYEMRDYVQAMRDLDAAIDDPRQPLNPEQRSEVDTLLSRARTFVGVYTVTTEPGTAELSLDGDQVQLEADGRLLLPFGEHSLIASADGYEMASTHLTVHGGERGELKLQLVPLTPVIAESAEPPLVQVKDFDLDDESSAANRLQTAPQSERRLRYTWLALGASAAFGGAAAVLWLLGADEVDKLTERCDDAAQKGSPCRPSETDMSEIERYELLTSVSLGLAGASLLATGVLAFVEWPRASDKHVAVGLGPSSLFVRGAF